MYIDEEMIQRMEARYGAPPTMRWEWPISEQEFRMVRASQKDGRAHDITLFILRGPQTAGAPQASEVPRVAVIRKPSFLPGVYRAPSGGLRPGETLEEGAQREAREETGLEVELAGYLLRVEARFRWSEERIDWTTHVFSARALHEQLVPQDRAEIAEARWVTLGELQGSIRQALLATGRALFAYRVALTDEAVARLNSKGSP